MENDKSITLDAQTGCLENAVSFIESELAAIACPNDKQMQIELAVEELFVNISNYAYRNHDGSVKIKFANPSKNRVIITLADNGTPFNPLEREEPDILKPLEEREPGGLGIFLVKRTMDNVVYKHDGEYNNITISKSW
ncbi:MAG: ATP-binding protein [Spirochaetaceae bacterium]|jgi:anti-sigma regulatory factor (Ser/Thr protein kinase)|nr:ATP-binding protein [Spirochaetaceae bacterium]